MRYIYFFDINEILIDRYPASVANSVIELNNAKDSLNFVFLYTERYISNNKPTNVPKNSIVIYKNHFDLRTLDSITSKYPPIVFITVGLRIPDIYLLAYFNKKGDVKTYMVQHGLFTSKLERLNPILFFLKRYTSIIRVIKYTYSLSKFLNLSFHKTFMEFYEIYFTNKKKLLESKSYTTYLISKTALIFDQTWDNYYTKGYGYKKDQLVYIGNPDYNLASDLLEEVYQENTICYICQSMVEDGRFDRNKFKQFLKDLKSNLGNKKIHLKLHPRSDFEMYKEFIDENFEVSNHLINCQTYLGHYSSLIKVPFLLGRRILIWELEGHSIPPEFDIYTNNKISNWNTFKELLNMSDSNEFIIQPEMTEYLSAGRNSMEITAHEILNNLK